MGAATSPPTPPPSTTTAMAMSPRKPMNQAWVGGLSPVPNSAVPVLPATPSGSPALAAVPEVTTWRIRSRRVSATPGSSGRGAGWRASRVLSVWSSSSLGARQTPESTVAATEAICSGLALTCACPKADMASSAELRATGARLVTAGMPGDGHAEAEAGGRPRQLRPGQPPGRELHERGVAGLGEGDVEGDRAELLLLEVADGEAAHLDVLGAGNLVGRFEAFLQQGGGGDHLEGRAGRVVAQGGALKAAVREVDHRTDRAGRGLQRDQRGEVTARVAQRALGGQLHARLDGGLHRRPWLAAEAAQHPDLVVVLVDQLHLGGRAARQAPLERLLEAALADRVAGLVGRPEA